MRTAPFLVLCVLVLMVPLLVVANKIPYNGNRDTTASTMTTTSVHSFSSQVSTECFSASMATGPTDWDTACEITDDVTSCSVANQECAIWYLCNGWVAEDTDPSPELQLTFPAALNVSQVFVSEQGARGWINEIHLKNSQDGLEKLVYKTTMPTAPSELYKPSPPQQAGRSYYAPGIDYRGGTNFTMAGMPCVQWPASNWSAFTGIGNHNYCRNPNNDASGPWCYTHYDVTTNEGGNETVTFTKEYCVIPPSAGCDDAESTYIVENPTLDVFDTVIIRMRPFSYAIAAIDAVSVTGIAVQGCHDDDDQGHWQSPQCTSCRFPYKGSECDSFNCDGGAACYNGKCNGSVCVCEAGFFGTDCQGKCPSSQQWTQGTDPSHLDTSQLCSGHGTCSAGKDGDGSCTCDSTWGKADCSAQCPSNPDTGDLCSDQGTCQDGAAKDGTCSCSGDFYGEDCSLTLCAGFKCYNGDCTDGKCICFRNAEEGYWSGPACDKCDSKYTGESCTERSTNEKVIRSTAKSGSGTKLELVALPDTEASVTVEFTDTSDESTSLEVKIGDGVPPAGCVGHIESASPTISCTVNISSITSGQAQVLSVFVEDVSSQFSFHGGGPEGTFSSGSGSGSGGSLDDGTPFTATIQYDPACDVSCEPHGYCQKVAEAVTEFEFDPYSSGAGSTAGGGLRISTTGRKVLAVPTNLNLNSISATRTTITLSVSVDVENAIAGAVALPSGTTPDAASPTAYTNPGDIYEYTMSGIIGVASPGTRGSDDPFDIVIYNLSPDTDYDVFFEGADEYYNYGGYDGPHSVTTAPHPSLSVDNAAIFATAIDLSLSASDTARICLCIVASGDGSSDCQNKTKCSDYHVDNTVLHLGGLGKSVAYDVYGHTVTYDAGNSTFALLGSYTTVAFPEGTMETDATSGTKLDIAFTPSEAGNLFAVVVDVDTPVPDPATLKNNAELTATLVADQEITHSFESLALDSNLKLLFITESTAPALSPVFDPIYFSTTGAMSIVAETADVKGAEATIRIVPNHAGLVTFAIRYSISDPISLENLVDCDSASPTVFCDQGQVEVYPSWEPALQLSIYDLEAATDYTVYIRITDAAGDQSAMVTLPFTTTLEGVTKCYEHDYKAKPSCTANSIFNNETSKCDCISGYSCMQGGSADGKCLNADEQAFLNAVKGTCECDNNEIDGFWEGDACDTCVDGYFGSNCELQCFGSSTLNAEKTACECPGGTKFEGIECNICPAYLGYYGPNCDTLSPLVSVTTNHVLHLNSALVAGMYRGMQFSPIAVKIRITDSLSTLGDLSSVTITTFKSYSEAIHLNVGSCPDPQTVAQLAALEKQTVSTLHCHEQDTWSSKSKVGVCTGVIPAYANFFSVLIATGNNQVSFSLTTSVASGCCNGNGLCGKYNDECFCAMDNVNGFWDERTSCKTCFPGYSDDGCNTVTDGTSTATTKSVSTEIGQSHWYALRVEPNMPWNVNVKADNIDCDLTVKVQPQCLDGWTYYDGRCFKIFPDDCVSVTTAEQRCRSVGGTLAVPKATHDLDFFAYMMDEANLLSDRRASEFCSRQIAIGLKKMRPVCTPTNKTRPKNETECDKYADSEGCSWFLKQCGFEGGISECGPTFATDKATCEDDAGTRRRCNFIEITDNDGWSDQSFCIPAWNLDGDWEYFNDEVNAADGPIGMSHSVHCSDLDEDECGNSYMCRWDDWAFSCVVDGSIINRLHPTDDMDTYSDRFFKTALTCAALFPRRDGSHVVVNDVPCTETDRAHMKPSYDPHDPTNVLPMVESPFMGYMCQRADTSESSTVDEDTKISPVASDTARVASPDCEALGPTHEETCSGVATDMYNYLMARVSCLQSGTFTANFEYVRKRRTEFEDPYSDVCSNSEADGSWAGSICTACAPRYGGDSCKLFHSCVENPSECGDHGTCNTGTGYCDCNTNYHGVNCQEFCDPGEPTCGAGSCSNSFESCPGGGPDTNTARACPLKDICKCPGKLAGPNCEECETGYWNTSFCDNTCDCNGQPCDPEDGTCNCYASEVTGYWTGDTCSDCKADYYGAKCTRYCTRADTCNGNGNCTKLGECTCESGFYGSNCQTKCVASTDCTNHGSCTTSGSCKCHASFKLGFWTGAKCDQCAFGYYGSNCDLECQCNAKGSCNKNTGACECHDDEKDGHYSGTHCETCAEGWGGSSCLTEENANSNLIGVVSRMAVGENARLLKDTSSDGASSMFTLNDQKYIYAAAGTQVSAFHATNGFVGACDFKALLGYGTKIVSSFAHDGYISFLLRGTSRSYLLPLSTTKIPMNSTHCNFAAAEAIVLWSTSVSTALRSSSPHAAIGAVYEPKLQLGYIFFEYTTGTPARTIVSLGLVDMSTIAKARNGITETMDLEQFQNASAIAIDLTHEEEPKVYLAGLNNRNNVLLAKVFAKTADLPSVRPAVEFQPHLCKTAACTTVAKMAYLGDKLVAAIDTSDRGVLLMTFDVSGNSLKLFETHYTSVAVLAGSSGCGFIAFDDYAETVLVGVGRSGKPTVIKKFSFPSLEAMPSSLTLQYGQSTSEIEIASSAIISADTREIYIVNKMTRANVLNAVLYDVQEIFPIVADGLGGTLINVSGTGFKKLGKDILCKFGGILNRQLKAVYHSDTLITCKAPVVVGYDPCSSVPLEVSFSGTKRFSNNAIQITHINKPNVASILPSQRGKLVATNPITVTGTGFLNTPYITCKIDSEQVPAEYISTTEVSCTPPPRSEPRQTTVEITLDGQKFSENGVEYFMVGLPTTMTGAWSNVAAGIVYSEVAKKTVRLNDIVVTFFDAAGTNIADADEAIRNATVTARVTSGATTPSSIGGHGILLGNLTQNIVDGVATFDDLHILYPGRGTYTVEISTNYSISDIPVVTLTFEITSVADKLIFASTYSKFTTNKAKLDQQPTLHLVDEVGNIVQTSGDVVKAEISPQPLEFASGVLVTGDSADVSLGIITFSDLWFKGNLSEKYVITFKVEGKNGIRPVSTTPLYTADCPQSNDLMDSITPTWITETVGATLTIKGWGFKSDVNLTLNFGSAKIPATYYDTCTAYAVIRGTNETATDRRRFQSSATNTVPTGTVSVSLSTDTQQSTTPQVFTTKAALSTTLGFSSELYESTAKAINESRVLKNDAYVGDQNITNLAERLTSCKSTTAKYCYKSDGQVHLYPIPIVHMDDSGGEIYDGFGWDASVNQDTIVFVNLVDKPAQDLREDMDEILVGGGSYVMRPTVNGLVYATNMYFVLPKVGEYILQFSSTTHKKTNLTITIEGGAPTDVNIVLNRNSTSISHSYNDTVFAERVEDDQLGVTISMNDMAGNPLGLDSFTGVTALRLTANVIPREIIQPQMEGIPNIPIGDINITEARATYGHVVISPSVVALANNFFDFQTSTVNGMYFGVLYEITFAFSAEGTSELPEALKGTVSVLLSRGNCPPFQYGVNMTTECATVPEGGEVREGNHSMYLFAQANYWRPHFTDTTFYACDASNCEGGFFSKCREGTTGPTCAVCQENFGKQGKECLRCPTHGYNVTIMVLFVLGMMVLIVLMVQANLDTTVKPKSTFSIIIKILMNHLQTASLMADFQEKVEGLVKDLADIQDRAAPDTSFVSFSCASKFSMYDFFIMWMLLPAFIIVLPAFVAFVVGMGQKVSYQKKLKKIEKEILRRETIGISAKYERMHLEALSTLTIPKELESFDNLEDQEYISPPLTDEDNFEDAYNELDRQTMNPLGPKRAKVMDRIHQKIADEVKYANNVISAPNPTDPVLVQDCQDFVSAVAKGLHDEIPVPATFDEYESRTTGLPFWVHRESGAGTWLRPSFMRYRGGRGDELLAALTKEDPTAAYKFGDEKALGVGNENNGSELFSSVAPGLNQSVANANDEDAENGQEMKELNDIPEVKKDGEKKTDAEAAVQNERTALEKAEAMRVDNRHGEDMARCSVCEGDFAIYTCKSCGGADSFVPYCETCWYVFHSKTTGKDDHVPVIYKTNDEIEGIIEGEKEEDESLDVIEKKKLTIVEEVRHLRGRHRPTTIYAVTVVVVVFLFYPHLMTVIAQMMKCRDITSTGESFLDIDMNVSCNTDKYSAYKTIAMICFILYGVGMPFCGTLLLLSKRKTLLHKDTISTYGFLYSGYKLEAFFWEFVIMIRKMLVVFIIVFYNNNDDKNYRIMFGMWLITAFLLLNVFMKPYQLSIYWLLENSSLASVVVTLNLSLLYQDQFAIEGAGDAAVTGIIFAVNLTVLVGFLYYLLYGLRIDFVKAFDTDGSGSVSLHEVYEGIKRRIMIAIEKRQKKKAKLEGNVDGDGKEDRSPDMGEGGLIGDVPDTHRKRAKSISRLILNHRRGSNFVAEDDDDDEELNDGNISVDEI